MDDLRSAKVFLFADKLNTAGALGMINEALSSRSLNGVVLQENICFAGAINPRSLQHSAQGTYDTTRIHASEG